MNFSHFIAKRFLGKKQSGAVSLISVISVTGIAVGVAVVIIALSVLDGFNKVVEEKIVNFNSHILISGFSGRNLPPLNSTKETITKLVGDELSEISEFVNKNVIIKSKTSTEGISLLGVDSNTMNKFTDLYSIESTGSETENSNTIILGKKLADRMLIEIGDKVTIFALKNDRLPSLFNPPSIMQFNVTGIYESGMAEYDDLKCYVEKSIAQKFFGLGEKVSGYNIRLSSLRNVDQITEKLQAELRYPFYVRSIFNEHQNIFTWIELQKKPIPIVLGMIILVAVFNIIGTILITVIEKMNSIGILKAIGSNRKTIIKIFLLQGFYLGIVGVLIGNILAFVLSYLQLEYKIISLPDTVYFLSSAPISMDMFNYVLVSVLTLFLCFLSSTIPSFIAGKIQPITAIRFK